VQGSSCVLIPSVPPSFSSSSSPSRSLSCTHTHSVVGRAGRGRRLHVSFHAALRARLWSVACHLSPGQPSTSQGHGVHERVPREWSCCASVATTLLIAWPPCQISNRQSTVDSLCVWRLVGSSWLVLPRAGRALRAPAVVRDEPPQRAAAVLLPLPLETQCRRQA
jgi:hypothetical protein